MFCVSVDDIIPLRRGIGLGIFIESGWMRQVGGEEEMRDERSSTSQNCWVPKSTCPIQWASCP